MCKKGGLLFQNQWIASKHQLTPLKQIFQHITNKENALSAESAVFRRNAKLEATV